MKLFVPILLATDQTNYFLLHSSSTYNDFVDTDGDDLPDYWELFYGFNSKSNDDSGGNPDGDIANNLAEAMELRSFSLLAALFVSHWSRPIPS